MHQITCISSNTGKNVKATCQWGWLSMIDTRKAINVCAQQSVRGRYVSNRAEMASQQVVHIRHLFYLNSALQVPNKLCVTGKHQIVCAKSYLARCAKYCVYPKSLNHCFMQFFYVKFEQLHGGKFLVFTDLKVVGFGHWIPIEAFL